MKPLKKLAKRFTPALFAAMKRQQKRVRFRFAHGGSEFRAKSALVKHFGKQVCSGPFKGMQYGDDVACSAYVAKLVGAYECELHAIIERIIERAYPQVIDVGCAEGYYAVGFAMRMRGALVYAFDIDPEAREYCADLASANGVLGSVKVRENCDHAALRKLCKAGTLLLCDCEGYEEQLLNLEAVPKLAHTDLLIELHEFIRPGLTADLLARFAKTHTLELIDTAERNVADFPQLSVMPAADRPWAIREGRPAAMQWAFLQSKSR